MTGHAAAPYLVSRQVPPAFGPPPEARDKDRRNGKNVKHVGGVAADVGKEQQSAFSSRLDSTGTGDRWFDKARELALSGA